MMWKVIISNHMHAVGGYSLTNISCILGAIFNKLFLLQG